jgi:hypothetical protein
MQAQAQIAARGPMKLEVRPITQSVRIGGKVSVEVSLRDASNQPVVWNQQAQVELDVSGASGKTEKYTLTIPPGQSAAQLTFDASEVGLLSLKAHEANGTLLPGGNSVLVNRAKPVNKALRVKPSAYQPIPASKPKRPLSKISWRISTLLAARTPTEQVPSETTPAVPPIAELLLTNSSGKDEILADGNDFARIQVYFMDPEGNGAPANIKVWLTWSNGELRPQPLVIKRGESFAEARWVSHSPIDATVSVVTSAPKYASEGSRELKVLFAPPIYGIAPSSPNPLRLSLIDSQPIVAQFFDSQGRTVQTNKPRRVTFVSSNPALHLDPSSFEVQPKESGATIFLLPTWSGHSTLDIWTPGYDHQTVLVEITMWLVLTLCLSGGVVGGIAAKDAIKGSIIWRIFVGILGAIVLVWFCVFSVLPQTHSVMAHNLVSVFVVGIVGGYGGTRVIDFAAKKLGYL